MTIESFSAYFVTGLSMPGSIPMDPTTVDDSTGGTVLFDTSSANTVVYLQGGSVVHDVMTELQWTPAIFGIAATITITIYRASDFAELTTISNGAGGGSSGGFSGMNGIDFVIPDGGAFLGVSLDFSPPSSGYTNTGGYFSFTWSPPNLCECLTSTGVTFDDLEDLAGVPLEGTFGVTMDPAGEYLYVLGYYGTDGYRSFYRFPWPYLDSVETVALDVGPVGEGHLAPTILGNYLYFLTGSEFRQVWRVDITTGVDSYVTTLPGGDSTSSDGYWGLTAYDGALWAPFYRYFGASGPGQIQRTGIVRLDVDTLITSDYLFSDGADDGTVEHLYGYYAHMLATDGAFWFPTYDSQITSAGLSLARFDTTTGTWTTQISNNIDVLVGPASAGRVRAYKWLDA